MEAKVEILPLLTIGSKADIKLDGNDFTVSQQDKSNINLTPLTTVLDPIEFEVSEFKTKTITEPIPPVNLFPLTTVLDSTEIIDKKCFKV